jgi:hypothetical protein
MKTLMYSTKGNEIEVTQSDALVGVVVPETGGEVYKAFRVFPMPDGRRGYNLHSVSTNMWEAIASLGNF